METSLQDIPKFRAPWWCFNDHVHTIARSLFGDREPPPAEAVEIATPDGDFLELECLFRDGSEAVIVLFHGLEGSARRYYMVEMMKSLSESEFSVVAVNFRSCGSRMNRQRRFYHSGATDDYRTVFRWVADRFAGQSIGAVGFSLGANALLKSLGEESGEHPVSAAVAVSVPYDLKMGSGKISRGFNKLYEIRFLRTLRNKVKEKRTYHPDLPEVTAGTLYEFDDSITAPIHGFKDADDYYECCSSKYYIDDIRRPTLLIHSRNDPLCPIRGMPMEKIKKNPFLDYIITDEGGHVGFWSSPPGWLRRNIVGYLSCRLQSAEN